jgi:hypothetical protein
MFRPNIKPYRVDEVGGLFRISQVRLTVNGASLISRPVRLNNASCEKLVIQSPFFEDQADGATANSSRLFWGSSEQQIFELVPGQFSLEIPVQNCQEVWLRAIFAMGGNDFVIVPYYYIYVP